MSGLYIILINYNNYLDTIACVDSLNNSSYSDFRIIIFDNHSENASYEKLLAKYSGEANIEILEADSNLGFAGGNNYAIRRSLHYGAEAVLLLNNDTEVEKDFLKNILRDWDFQSVRTPRINYFNDGNSVWYAAGNFNARKGIVENGDPLENSYVNFASGCCMLLPRKIFSEVGYLDESFFMYYEDVDYSLRLINAGFLIEYISDAIVYHKVGRSSGGKSSRMSIYYNNRNRFYIIKKYRLGLMCILYTVLTRIFRLFAAIFAKNYDMIILDAWRDFMKGVTGKSSKY